MDEPSCENLCILFRNRFAADPKKYPVDTQKLHNVLIINEKVYPGYEDYGLHQGSKNCKNSKETTKKINNHNLKKNERIEN